jgi:hypothetical protein
MCNETIVGGDEAFEDHLWDEHKRTLRQYREHLAERSASGVGGIRVCYAPGCSNPVPRLREGGWAKCCSPECAIETGEDIPLMSGVGGGPPALSTNYGDAELDALEYDMDYLEDEFDRPDRWHPSEGMNGLRRRMGPGIRTSTKVLSVLLVLGGLALAAVLTGVVELEEELRRYVLLGLWGVVVVTAGPIILFFDRVTAIASWHMVKDDPSLRETASEEGCFGGLYIGALLVYIIYFVITVFG